MEINNSQNEKNTPERNITNNLESKTSENKTNKNELSVRKNKY